MTIKDLAAKILDEYASYDYCDNIEQQYNYDINEVIAMIENFIWSKFRNSCEEYPDLDKD